MNKRNRSSRQKSKKRPTPATPKSAKTISVKTAGASSPRRGSAAGQAQEVKADAGAARKATLDEWFEAIRSHAASTADSGSPKGACLVPDPNGGPSFCVEMTQEACTSPAVKGSWSPGNC